MSPQAIEQFYLSKYVTSNFSCTFDKTVVITSSGSFYWVDDSKAEHIPTDPYSLGYYASLAHAFSLPMPYTLLAAVLTIGGSAPAGLLARELPGGSVIETQSTYMAGNSWVVLNGDRELIPHAWDDACWERQEQVPGHRRHAVPNR
jgi:hypothetical protein